MKEKAHKTHKHNKANEKEEKEEPQQIFEKVIKVKLEILAQTTEVDGNKSNEQISTKKQSEQQILLDIPVVAVSTPEMNEENKETKIDQNKVEVKNEQTNINKKEAVVKEETNPETQNEQTEVKEQEKDEENREDEQEQEQ
jgi:hypothetical protein